jgi:aminoglycoside N3'-acetyltransferase
MTVTIEFKGGPLDGKTVTVGSDFPDPTILHIVEHPSPNGIEVWRYRLSNYDTNGTSGRAVYNEPMKLPS